MGACTVNGLAVDEEETVPTYRVPAHAEPAEITESRIPATALFIYPNEHQTCACVILLDTTIICRCTGLVPSWGQCLEAKGLDDGFVH